MIVYFGFATVSFGFTRNVAVLSGGGLSFPIELGVEPIALV